MSRLMIFLFRFYQWAISPFIGNHCRFYPSCSEYACQAVARYGVLNGGWRTCKRLCRCHPWHPGGYDPLH